MDIALFLHLYQPPTQDPQVTRKITRRSYAPLVELLGRYPAARVTINLTGSLLEQWLEQAGDFRNRSFARSRTQAPSPPPAAAAGFRPPNSAGSRSLAHKDSYPSPEACRQTLAGFQELYQRGQIELTTTAMYHPLLPTLPAEEVMRQIELDLAIKREVFGKRFRPAGFFPPEMVYTPELARIVEKMGFEWIILDESAHPLSSVQKEAPEEHAALHLGDAIYQIAGTKLKVFFRDREASLKVAFSDRLSLDKFFSTLNPQPSTFQILALDGETFGHHRPGMWGWLRELLQGATNADSSAHFVPEYRLVTLSDLSQAGFSTRTINPITSTWGVTIEEPDQSRTFPRWQNPLNPVHSLQWKLYELALEVGRRLPTDLAAGNWEPEARKLLDQALHSDQFWWASHAPCWNLGMVEKGAALLRDAILFNPKATEREKDKARYLFGEILEVGKREYGEKVVGC